MPSIFIRTLSDFKLMFLQFPKKKLSFRFSFYLSIKLTKDGRKSEESKKRNEIRRINVCLRGKHPSQITIYEHFSIKHTIAINNTAPANDGFT